MAGTLESKQTRGRRNGMAKSVTPHAMAPTKVAVLGAGLFVHNAYLPFLKKHPEEAELVAVWSRSEASATSLQKVALEVAPTAQFYHGEEGLDALLGRADVKAVWVVAAPQGMLEVVREALAAGKHVLSEKPAGPTVAGVRELLRWQRRLTSPPLWCVEENYRVEPAFLRAADMLRELGPIVKLDLVADLPLTPESKYYGSSWRRDISGGFMTEGSVHFMAALRLLARAAGWGEAAAASGVATVNRSDLPAPDTLVGMARFGNGAAASISISFAGTTPRRSLIATGLQGTVEVLLGGWQASSSYQVISQKAGDAAPTTQSYPITGVPEALCCFLRCVRQASSSCSTALGLEAEPVDSAVPAGGTRGLQDTGGAAGAEPERDHDAVGVSCLEAARDLALVEALLESSQLRGQLVAVKQLA